MLPVAVMVAIGLALSGWWRGLAAWLGVVVGVLGTMAFLKYLFFACAGPFEGTGIHSPSGHTAASSAIYGGLALLLLRGRAPPAVLAAIPLAIAAVFGVSRLAVHAHTPPEVLAGAAVGLTGAAMLALSSGLRPAMRAWPIVAAVVVVALVCHGLRLQAESMVHNFALFTWLPLPAMCRA